jgi:hypothetical protein
VVFSNAFFNEGILPVRKAVVQSKQPMQFLKQSELYCFNLVSTADVATVTFSVAIN